MATDLITKADIEKAAERIAGRVRETPVTDAFLGTPLTLKLEMLQHTGSFKPRGMFNRMLAAGVSPACAGVIAASGGNAGLAVAYAARELGCPAEIFVPETASPVKVARLHAYGATVHQVGRYYADALAASMERAAETGAVVIHAYDHPDVQAGQGTLARELPPDVDTVLVAVGGGGLFTGIATWMEGSARVVAVEPTRCPTLHTALERGEIVDVDVSGVGAEVLGARTVTENALRLAQRDFVSSVLVSDDAIMAARRALWEELRLVTEPGGVAALAAVLSGAYVPAPGERVCVILCGANTDPSDLVVS